MSSVAFIHRGGDFSASYRYRAKIPASMIDNHEVSINEGNADIVVFSKPCDDDIEIAESCKNDGTKVVVDYCDDHFGHEKLGSIYRHMAGLADTIVCNTPVMQDIIHKETGKDSYTINDPYEQERCEPHAVGDRVLWFGHPTNINEIVPWVEKIDELTVCTGPNSKLEGYIQWSEANMKRELDYTNTVLLPGRKNYKSPNRLINAVIAGCFVVTSKHPSAKEFREFMWVGNIPAGLQWRKHFSEDLNALVLAGQDYIEDKFSPKVVGEQWTSLLDSL